MNDRLHQLALFIRTVETGSFSQAAREFGLTQPSVSRAIATLESRLGVALLRRTTRRLAVTDAGQTLLVHAREALAAVDDAENAARATDELTGTLRVALPPAFGIRAIIPLLPGFLALNPALRVDLMMSDRFEDLVAEGADLALRLGRQPDSSFLTHKLASVPRIVVASPLYLRRRGAPKSAAELADHDCLGGPGDRPRTVWSFRREGGEESVALDIRVQTGSGIGVVACAEAGLGIAVASTWMCGDGLREGRLVRLLADYGLDPVEAFVVFPSGRRASRKARAFSDYLAKALADAARESLSG
jgi:DNA-binding transcriptional LysR family regulator